MFRMKECLFGILKKNCYISTHAQKREAIRKYRVDKNIYIYLYIYAWVIKNNCILFYYEYAELNASISGGEEKREYFK